MGAEGDLNAWQGWMRRVWSGLRAVVVCGREGELDDADGGDRDDDPVGNKRAATALGVMPDDCEKAHHGHGVFSLKGGDRDVL